MKTLEEMSGDETRKFVVDLCSDIRRKMPSDGNFVLWVRSRSGVSRMASNFHPDLLAVAVKLMAECAEKTIFRKDAAGSPIPAEEEETA